MKNDEIYHKMCSIILIFINDYIFFFRQFILK